MSAPTSFAIGLLVVLIAAVILLGRIGQRPDRRGRHAIASWQELTEASHAAHQALQSDMEDRLEAAVATPAPVPDLSTPDTVRPLRSALLDAGAADPDTGPVYDAPTPCTIPGCPTCATWPSEAIRAYENSIQTGNYWFRPSNAARRDAS